MTETASSNPFDDYPKAVARGLGFPNDRDSATPQPTGWIETNQQPVENVSRETSSEAIEARRAQL